MKVILWIKIFAIIQYFRATLPLLTVITGKKQAFWNSNDLQRSSLPGMPPLLLAIYQIGYQWESHSARWRTVKSTGSTAPHAGFQPGLKMGSQTPILSHGWWRGWSWLLEIFQRWECFTGNRKESSWARVLFLQHQHFQKYPQKGIFSTCNILVAWGIFCSSCLLTMIRILTIM